MNFEQSWAGGAASMTDSTAIRRRNRRRISIVAVVLVLIVGAIVLMVRMWRTPPTTAVAPAPTVTVIRPGRTDVTATISTTGTIAAKRQLPVGIAGEGGMVSRVLVDAGRWVKAGQILAIVDPAVQTAQLGQSQAQISSAEANAKLAQSQLDRAQALVSRGFISKSDIDQRIATRDAALAAVTLAHAQLREQSARLGRLDIRAPAAGFILARGVEPGQIVSSASGTLFTIAEGGTFEFDARLAEQDLSSVHIGLPVVVTPVGTSRHFTGTVWQISPTIDPTSRQGLVRVELAYDPALRPGGFASASFVADHSLAPLLPESAVMADGRGTNYVYVVDGQNIVEKRDVKVGDVSDNGIAIAQGLSGSEQVVYSAGAFLNVGDRVIPSLKTSHR